MHVQTIVGQGKLTYRVDKEWGRRAGGVPASRLSPRTKTPAKAERRPKRGQRQPSCRT